MSRSVVPIANISRRIPEAGRIRIGVKTERAMKSIPEFRFTSHDREALTQIAEMYGGNVVPWSDAKAAPCQFEVITAASEIRVLLPPDPLGNTPIYEQWGGGGCERRCDGLTCQMLQQGPDGLEPVDVPCMCAASGEMVCDVKTRLAVIIPEIRFAGVWRLDTKSWNAAQELPGMVDMIQAMQGRGLSYATLGIKARRSVVAGKTKQFNVPVLGVGASIEQLAAGAARLGALPSAAVPPVAELESGETAAPPAAVAPPAVVDDAPAVIDAVIVELPAGTPPAGREPTIPDEPASDAQSRAVHALLRRKHMAAGPDRFPILTTLLGREITSSKELSKADAGHVIEQLQQLPDATS